MALATRGFYEKIGRFECTVFVPRGGSSVRVCMCVCLCVHYIGAAFGACTDTVYDAMAIYNAMACLFLFLWKSIDQGCVHMMPVAGWKERCSWRCALFYTTAPTVRRSMEFYT